MQFVLSYFYLLFFSLFPEFVPHTALSLILLDIFNLFHFVLHFFIAYCTKEICTINPRVLCHLFFTYPTLPFIIICLICFYFSFLQVFPLRNLPKIISNTSSINMNTNLSQKRWKICLNILLLKPDSGVNWTI